MSHCGIKSNADPVLRWEHQSGMFQLIRNSATAPERLIPTGVAPVRPHPVPPQQAVLVLSQSRQRHEEDALLGPAGLGGDGEHLGR